MDGDRRAPAAAAASVAEVLGGGDLLRDILLRLAFPHYLVCAALVSKEWLLLVSDPAFLRRFRDRHPPRLLGFCVRCPARPYEFVPLPQPPELAAFARRAASSCNNFFAARRGRWIKHCRNGRLLIECPKDGVGPQTFDRVEYSLLTPLLAGDPIAALPPAPLFSRVFLPEDGRRDGITMVNLYDHKREVRATVKVLGSGGWGVQTTAVIEVETAFHVNCFLRVLPPVHGKIFMVTSKYTLMLDLAAPRFSILELPDGVESHGATSSFLLSRAENSGLYLVNAEGFQISVWLHAMTGDGAGGWLLVDTFCVREECACLDSWVPQVGGSVEVAAIGDYADFVFLEHAASGAVFYVHLRSKTVQKVYQRVPEEGYVVHGIAVFPIMMIWPPVFRPRNIGHGQQE